MSSEALINSKADKHGWTGETTVEEFPIVSTAELTDGCGLIDMMLVESGKYLAPRFPVSWIDDGGQTVDEDNIQKLQASIGEERTKDGGDSSGQNQPIQIRIVVGNTKNS